MQNNRRAVRRVAYAALVAVCAAGCTGAAPGVQRNKLVILGFDGMDPDLVKQYVDAGQLPTFKKLMAQGGLYPLETTVSPESPTAWASFATGTNPGKHNIYDFLVRDLDTYFPDLGMITKEPPRFLFNWIPIARPKVLPLRGGTSFWVTAGQAGVRSSILTVPMTFPPEEVPNGELLSGLPTPDIRGTMGTFYYFATDLSRLEEGDTEMGGKLKRLIFENGRATAPLVGPPNPIVKAQLAAIAAAVKARGGQMTDAERTGKAELEAREDVTIPVEVAWTRGTGRAEVAIGDEKIAIGAGEWSRWVPLQFRVNVFITIRGMVQLYAIRADDELQLYVSPVNFAPEAPPTPISSPARFAADLRERVGPFRTLGWAEATWPLEEHRITEDVFMNDLYRAFDDRAQVILNRVTSGQWDLLIGVIESTDRVQHMMYRLLDPTHPMYDKDLAAKHGDAILRVYRRADDFVAQVMQELPADTPVLIVSDHGFHSWRQSVNLNTWLAQKGYLVRQGEPAGEKKLNDLFSGGQFWEGVDWSRTRAYAMGLGQIYFNLRGREGQGIVSPGQEYVALADELAAKLKTELLDPVTGAHIVSGVYKRDDVYSGEFLHNASDLQVGFVDGYRVSWQTTLGGSPEGVVYPNTRKWSGDHGGFDYQATAGVLISNRPLATATPRIIDLASTVLEFYGVAPPAGLDGRPLYRR